VDDYTEGGAREGVRRLDCYKRSMELVEEVYRVSAQLPPHEQFGLVSQMRRAATYIPMNIAEGYGRRHRGDYVRSLSIARGSAFEVDTQLEIATRLQMLGTHETATAQSLCHEVRKMLGSMIQRLAADEPHSARGRP
jgi:four helix bundle protein